MKGMRRGSTEKDNQEKSEVSVKNSEKSARTPVIGSVELEEDNVNESESELIFEEEEVQLIQNTQKRSPESNVSSKKRHPWTSSEDLQLLRMVYVTRPFEGKYRDVPKNWDIVFKNLPDWGRNVKSARAHFEFMFDKFISDERKSLLGSGTEEDFDEKIQILGHITALIESSKATKADLSKKEKAIEEADRQKGLDIRVAAMSGMKAPDGKTESGSTKRGSDKEDLSILLREKYLADSSSRKDELEFKKFKFSTLMEERREDRKLELKRLELQEKSQNNQSRIMEELLRQLSNK